MTRVFLVWLKKEVNVRKKFMKNIASLMSYWFQPELMNKLAQKEVCKMEHDLSEESLYKKLKELLQKYECTPER